MVAEYEPESIDEAIKTLPLDNVVALENETAFTHVSRYGAMKEAFETSIEHGYMYDYERMELLGDAILSMLVTLTVRELFPLATVGTATVMHHALVSNKTLAKLSRHYKLNEKLIASLGQIDDLQENYKIQAAMFEAYVCGLHDELGIESARKFIWATYAPLAKAEYARLRKVALGKPAVMRTSRKKDGLIEIRKPDFSKPKPKPTIPRAGFAISGNDLALDDALASADSSEGTNGTPDEDSLNDEDYDDDDEDDGHGGFATVLDEHSAVPPGNYVAKLIDAKRLGLYTSAEFRDGETIGVGHQLQHETILIVRTREGAQTITAWGSKKQEGKNRAAYLPSLQVSQDRSILRPHTNLHFHNPAVSVPI